MRWIRAVVALVLILVIAGLSFSVYLTHTQSGAQALVAMVGRMLGGNATVGSVQGTLNDRLILTDVIYRDRAAGIDVRLARAVVEIELRSIAAGRLRFRNIDAYGLVVSLSAAQEQAATDPLSLPIDVQLVRLNLINGELQRAGKPAISISSLALQAQWRGQRVVVQSAVLVAPAGTLSVSGELQTHEPFVDRLEGSLQWQLGDRVVAGSMTVRSAQRSIHIVGDLTAPIAARLEATVEVSPTLNWTVEASLPSFNPRQQLIAASPIEEASAELRARGDSDSAHVNGHLMLDGKRVNLLANGRFDASGDSIHLTSAGTMESLVRGRAAEVSWKISVADQRAEVEELTLNYGGGRLSAQGHVALVSHPQWQLAIAGERFDPGLFLPQWPGSIDASLVTAGQFGATGPEGSIQVEHLSGVLKQRPLSGSGILRLSPDKSVSGKLQLRSADTQLLITGERGASGNLLAELQVPSLSEWYSPLSGALTMRIQARGRWPQVSIVAEAHANAIEYERIKATDLQLALAMRDPKHPSGRIDIQARNVAVDEVTFDSIQALLSGSEQDHSLEVRATGDPATIVASVRGSLARHAWSGAISQLQLDVEDYPRVSLRAPATLELTRTRISLSESCLVGEQAELCLASKWRQRGAASLSYSIRQLPLGLITRLAAGIPNLAVEGALDGRGDIERDANGEMRGSAQLGSQRGRVRYTAEKDASLEYTDAELKVSFEGVNAHGDLSAKLGSAGEIVAAVSLDDLRANDPSLHGKGSIRAMDISLFAVLVPQLANLQGRAEATFTAEGSLQRPQVGGNIDVTALQSEVPSLGLRLHDGSVSVQVQPPGPARLSGRMSSGSGVVEVDGLANSIDDFELGIKGSDVTAVDLPGARVVIAPDLKVSRKAQITTLAGTLEVPRADVDLDLLIGHSPRRASSDVVLVDRASNVEARSVALHTDVDVVLGNNVKLKGAGFDGQLGGRVRVREVKDQRSTGSGEITVAGTYELYGRSLTIEHARLLYAGTPLDDPQLDVLATRKLPDATVQVRVTGTAQQPKLALSTDDDMTQTEALAYLLTGRPPEELRQEDGAMLQSAKDSLGAVVGDRLARRVGNKLGIDDVGVEQSAELGSSALTIGKYLSPRLFVSYGVGLFEPGRVVTVRYRINRSVSVEANRAPDSQHAGVEYRVER